MFAENLQGNVQTSDRGFRGCKSFEVTWLDIRKHGLWLLLFVDRVWDISKALEKLCQATIY